MCLRFFILLFLVVNAMIFPIHATTAKVVYNTKALIEQNPPVEKEKKQKKRRRKKTRKKKRKKIIHSQE